MAQKQKEIECWKIVFGLAAMFFLGILMLMAIAH